MLVLRHRSVRTGRAAPCRHERGEDRFYYITMYNEDYAMPPMPEGDGVREGILRGIIYNVKLPKKVQPRCSSSAQARS